MDKCDRMHSCSLCGGGVMKRIDDIILKFPEYVAVLEKAEVGECINCGERYHPASTSERIQARINELLNSHTITDKDRKKIDIFSAQHVSLGDVEAISQLTQRVLALESSVEKLATAVNQL